MSLKSIKAALEARLVAIASPLPTEWENVTFTPPATGAYQAADLLPASPENPTLGATHHREIGIFQIMLLYPLAGGSGPAYAKAVAIQAWFPRGLSLSGDGITVRIPRTPTIGPKRINGDRFCVPVSVRYEADIFT